MNRDADAAQDDGDCDAAGGDHDDGVEDAGDNGVAHDDDDDDDDDDGNFLHRHENCKVYVGEALKPRVARKECSADGLDHLPFIARLADTAAVEADAAALFWGL